MTYTKRKRTFNSQQGKDLSKDSRTYRRAEYNSSGKMRTWQIEVNPKTGKYHKVLKERVEKNKPNKN